MLPSSLVMFVSQCKIASPCQSDTLQTAWFWSTTIKLDISGMRESQLRSRICQVGLRAGLWGRCLWAMPPTTWNSECGSKKPRVHGESGALESDALQELLRAQQQLGEHRTGEGLRVTVVRWEGGGRGGILESKLRETGGANL